MKKLISLILVVATVVCIVPLYSFAAYENTHINSGDMAADLIAVAQTQLGYCEGNDNTQLDGTVKGSGDYTKYGQWYGLCPAAWCAMFISWCANQANIPTSVIPKFANCDTGMAWYQNNGRWYDGAYYGGKYTPKVGDIAFYGYKSGNTVDSTHVGIVYKVDSTNIYSLEGNSSAKVQTVAYKLSSAYVLGYGNPNYSDTSDPVSKEAGRYMVTEASSLNIRLGPSSEYGKLGILYQGNEVEVKEIANDHWGQIDYNGKAGWISLAYCSKIFTVRFNASGGFGSPSPQDKIENRALTLSSTIPTKSGYKFLGWTTKSGSSVVEYKSGDSFYLNSDTTLYAVWGSDNTYTISYDAKGGTGAPPSQEKTKGETITISTTKPTRVGYIFVGWSYTDSGIVSIIQPGDKWSIDADKTLYAVWRTTGEFVDVGSDKWYTEAVYWCSSRGYMNGTSDTTFSPGATLTRAMYVTIIANISGVDLSKYSMVTSFSDVPKGKWYHDAVEWAYSRLIVTGTGENIFTPSGNITRQDMAVIMYRYAEYRGYSTSFENNALDAYTDRSSVSSYAQNAMKWAVSNGIMNGTSGNALSPKSQATRSQAATIVKNFCISFDIK